VRITNKVLTTNFLGNLRNNLTNMQKYQNQLSSGKEVSRPSDDPFRVARTMELTANINANERYAKNIEEGIGWLYTTDTALGQIGDAMQTIYEKTVAGGNGAYSEGEREALKLHIQQLKEQIAEVGNTSYDGRYIFGGDKTNVPPFTTQGVYQGSANGLVREFSQGVTLDIGTKGNQFEELFTKIDEIISDLGQNKSPSDRIAGLQQSMENVLKLRAEAGARSRRLEAMMSKNEDETFNMTALLSKTYDIDVAEKVMEYKVMESVYNASLQTGAKILQPSLLDFLR
jgi:flagellar hook-associated protein 3 FlgL